MSKIEYKDTIEYKEGLKIFKERWPEDHHQKIDDMYEFFPELAHTIVGQIIYDTWERKTSHLTLKEKELSTIACLLGMGTSPNEVIAHIDNALRFGVTKEQIKNLISLVTPYCGIPHIFDLIPRVKKKFAEFDSEKK